MSNYGNFCQLFKKINDIIKLENYNKQNFEDISTFSIEIDIIKK